MLEGSTDKREGHCLQLCAPCSCPANPEGLALCWTAVGEVLCASNSRYSSARIFYQQRSRGDRAAARLFLPFPVLGKGRALRVWHLSAVYCWICGCRAVCSPQGPSHLLFLLDMCREYWRKNEWILGNKSGDGVIVGLNWCSRGENTGFWILQSVIARGALSWRREVDNLLHLMQRIIVSDSFCQPWISFKRLCDSCSVSAVFISGNLIVSLWISCPEYVRVHFAVL